MSKFHANIRFINFLLLRTFQNQLVIINIPPTSRLVHSPYPHQSQHLPSKEDHLKLVSPEKSTKKCVRRHGVVSSKLKAVQRQLSQQNQLAKSTSHYTHLAQEMLFLITLIFWLEEVLRVRLVHRSLLST